MRMSVTSTNFSKFFLFLFAIPICTRAEQSTCSAVEEYFSSVNAVNTLYFNVPNSLIFGRMESLTLLLAQHIRLATPDSTQLTNEAL